MAEKGPFKINYTSALIMDLFYLKNSFSTNSGSKYLKISLPGPRNFSNAILSGLGKYVKSSKKNKLLH